MTIEELYSIYRNCGYKVTTDSRAISGGELFFALRGENFDGNDYAAGALEKGAAYAVVNDDAAIDCDGSRLIRVKSPFELSIFSIDEPLNTMFRPGKLSERFLTSNDQSRPK